jgi:hypothetical protein
MFKKFGEFAHSLNEDNRSSFSDSPESYIESVLLKIKQKIEKFFKPSEEVTNRRVVKIGDKDFEEKVKKSDNKLNFADMGLELQSSEYDKSTPLYHSIDIKFTDSQFLYDLYLMIKLEEAIPVDKTKDVQESDITECFIKFKKYDIKMLEVVNKLSKNIKISDIDEDFIVNLKLELDKSDEESSGEFKIETE